jgi:hypothetical protein
MDTPRVEDFPFFAAIYALDRAGYGDDVVWAESVGPPPSAEEFASETIFVICNSGMRFTVARGIYDRVMAALRSGESSARAFGHQGKTGAIDRIWADRDRLYGAYLESSDKLAFLRDLPWIGGITCYHLAKNFGLPVAKPDVHLARLAATFNTTPQELCERLSRIHGFKVATIDTVLWRAAATGLLDTKTGRLQMNGSPGEPSTNHSGLFEP